LLRKRFDLHPLAIETALTDQRPVEEYADHPLVIQGFACQASRVDLELLSCTRSRGGFR
jgi:hypothetical protein